MAKLGAASGRPRPVMNVTPLVDIVLVLLIIFMVVIPMMERAANVDLPSIFNVDDDPRGQADPFTLSVTRDGSLFLEDERLSPGDLEARLREVNRREPHRRLVLRGDRQARYAHLRALFAICQRIGFPGVSLSVHERGEGSG